MLAFQFQATDKAIYFMPLSIFSLACHRDIDHTVSCLGSFTARCKDAITLTLLSDGTLTPEDTVRLQTALPAAKVLERSDVDPIVLPALKDFPLCRKYREWCPWALKLLDIPIWAKSDFVYIDSDILFLRDFTGLAAGAQAGFNIVSMRAYASIYSFSLGSRLALGPQIPLNSHLNAGFLFVRQSGFNLELVERFLHGSERHKSPFLWEQTAWAAMAAHTSSAHFSRTQIAFPQFALDRHHRFKFSPVALHFVGGTRHLIAKVQSAAAQWPRDPSPLGLTLEKSTRLTRAGHGIDLLRHRLLVRRCRQAGICQ